MNNQEIYDQMFDVREYLREILLTEETDENAALRRNALKALVALYDFEVSLSAVKGD